MFPTPKNTVPNIEIIHYWSNFPTSQYIFDLIGNHFEKYGIMVYWNYFEPDMEKDLAMGWGKLVNINWQSVVM